MKKLLVMLALVISTQSFAESVVLTVASPFITATRLLVVTVASPFISTVATLESRGVAGQEQMRDELVALNDDMVAGQVKSIDEVRQPALKELFQEISSSEENMAEINSVLKGSELEKVAAATAALLM